MSSVLSSGDILQVKCGQDVAYVTYVGRLPNLGDLIWVIPRVFSAPVADHATVLEIAGYFAFYPAHAALRQHLVRKVGFSESAVRLPPSRWRNAIRLGAERIVSDWFISDGASRVRRSDHELSPEERALPIADVWNHEYLCARLRERWTPAQPFPF
jgi:hypothetical protein